MITALILALTVIVIRMVMAIPILMVRMMAAMIKLPFKIILSPFTFIGKLFEII